MFPDNKNVKLANRFLVKYATPFLDRWKKRTASKCHARSAHKYPFRCLVRWKRKNVSRFLDRCRVNSLRKYAQMLLGKYVPQ